MVFLSTFSQVYGVEGGYFNTQNGSEYLGFANMNKEFEITSLMNSAIANDFKATKIFIASGSDVNETNIAKVSALHLAARNYAYDSAQVLIENGANINAKDSEGWTPLMRASLNGDEKIMKLLLENGASVWTQNVYGDTALIHTAMADCYECGKLLLENTETQRGFAKDQIRNALDITKKRYNEPFIELLTGYISNGGVLVLSSPIKHINLASDKNSISAEEDITRIIYKFLGKTINAAAFEECNKSIQTPQIQNEKKLMKLNQNNGTIESRKMKKSFSFTGKRENSITLQNDLRQNEVQNNKIVNNNEEIQNIKGAETKFVFKKIDKPIVNDNVVNKIETKADENLTTDTLNDKEAILESEPVYQLNKNVKTFNIQKKEKNNTVENINSKEIAADTLDKEEINSAESKPAYQLNNDVKTFNIQNKETNNVIIEDVKSKKITKKALNNEEIILESKPAYQLNNDVKTFNIQKKDINNVVVEDTENKEISSKNFILKPTKQNVAPISNIKEQSSSDAVYSLQSDRKTLN
ncbi:MAG: ankyrin repeat domain-containing protein [Rickettsiales bacterium]|nr:ankyrin repeat domain-containing protein [Rickettsiales bacterium]